MRRKGTFSGIFFTLAVAAVFLTINYGTVKTNSQKVNKSIAAIYNLD